MKKFTRILALTLVLVMSVAMFASCAAPNKDPKKAKEALEKNDYTIALFVEGEEAEAAGAVMKLEKLTGLISASKDKDLVEIFYFEDAAAADAALDTIQELSDKAGNEVKVKKSGSMVYYGTAAAIKAAK